MQQKQTNNNKYYQRRRIAFLIFLLSLLIIVIGISIILFSKKMEFDTDIKLTFSDRSQQLEEFSYEDYYNVGWIQVQGTNIDGPILNKAAHNVELPEISFGWRSTFYVSGENREVLVGHNIINVSSTPIRDMEVLDYFEGLLAFTYHDFAQENLYISYNTGDGEELYKIYAIGFNDYEEDDGKSFKTEEETKAYIEKVKKNSIYNYDVDVNEKDHIITVKTCTRYFGLFENQEFAVEARKVRDGEEINRYKVEKSDNYDMLSKTNGKENG